MRAGAGRAMLNGMGVHRWPKLAVRPGELPFNLLFVLWLLTPCVSFAAVSLDGLLAELKLIQHRNQTPAFAVVIAAHDGPLHVGAYGVADLATQKPVSDDTIFRIGSITKTITALTTLKAIEKGCLGLNDAFSEHADSDLIDNPWRQRHKVTIAELLEHTAGLKDLSHHEMYHNDPTPMPLSQAIRQFASNRSVHWYPGEHYSYSNAGAGLVAYAVGEACGETFENFATREVLRPLGMHSAGWRLDSLTRTHLAVGYDTDKRTPIPYWHMLFRPFGGLNVRPQDMSGLLMALINRGHSNGRQVFEPDSIRRMETPMTSLAARAGLMTGYGLGIYSWFSNGHRFFGHGGDGDGYLAHFGYSLTAKTGYFVVINAFTHTSLGEMRDALEAFIAARSPVSEVSTGSKADRPALPEEALGAYVHATTRFGNLPPDPDTAITLSRSGHDLLVSYASGSTEELLSAGDNRWRRAGDPDACAALATDHQGRWTFFIDRVSYLRGIRD